MDKYICIHGHFYQPPRENPWLEEVELQEGAYPYHDWNEKITAECYAPNAASRILDSEGKIIDIVNIYSKISFDFGPTLLSWLRRQKPDVYQALLEADRSSMDRFSGHGSAMAQAYNHVIMPLANRKDKYTQVIWGIKDFQKRFNRFPEGMWLPEAAVNIETLEILAGLGIKFTILSPRQAKRICRIDEPENWQDVSGERVDTSMAYLCKLPSGKAINLFFFNGPVSREVSFGELLKNGEAFTEKLLSVFDNRKDWHEIVNIATDGETFGHHHRHGDMALSYCLHLIESNNLAKITNYGEYLEKNPPNYVVEIFENSSWSCVHGVERWRDNCGCSTGKHPDWTQAWRGPLRNAVDWLRDELTSVYIDKASGYFRDIWKARNDYIDVIFDRSHRSAEDFFRKHAIIKLTNTEKKVVLKLMETQRNAMMMYTSCGWFFDEVSGIETVQIMQYSSRAIQYLEELYGLSLEIKFLKRLEKVPSNIYKDAAGPYRMFVAPARSDILRAGAHYSISSIFEEYPEDIKIFCYTAKAERYKKIEAGRQKLAVGKANIISDITREEKVISFAVLHLGDHNINAGVKSFTGGEDFSIMHGEIEDAFVKGNIPEVIRLIDKHFENNIYSFWHLFKDEQRKVLDQILQITYDGIETSYRQIYENNYSIMNFFHVLQIRLPKPFLTASEYILNADMRKIFEADDLALERLKKLIDEAKRWSINVDKTTMGFVAGLWTTSLMDKLKKRPEDIDLSEIICNAMELLKPLSLSMDLWKAQNIYFSIGSGLYDAMKEKSAGKDNFAERWIKSFLRLGHYLHVKIS